MKKNKLIIISLATALILFGAYKSSVNVVSKNVSSVKLLPDLAKNIDNIGNVIIKTKGKSFQLHLENGQWVMPDRFSYPIGIEKIRNLVQSAANTQVLEKKTSDQEKLKDIGLDNSEDGSGSGVRVILQNADGSATYADYIRGVNRKGVSSAGHDDIYARLASNNKSYLVHSELSFDLTPHALLSGETFTIPYNKLQSIEFNYPGHSYDNFTIGKGLPTDLDFAILEPKDKKIKSYGKVNAISTSLEYMDLEDIIPVENFQVKEPEVIITYKTFNGLTTTVKLFDKDNEKWLTFTANADEKNNQASIDAAKINNLAAKWVYQVDFKSTGGFYYKLGDLLKE